MGTGQVRGTMGAPGPGWTAPRPKGGSEDHEPLAAAGRQARHLWGHVALCSEWDGAGLERPRVGEL